MISQLFNDKAFSQAIGESDLEDALRKNQGIIDNKIKEIYGSEEIEENNFTRENYIGGINSEYYDCTQSNLSQEQLVECEYLKNQNVIGADGDYKDWSSDLTTEQIIQQNEDLDKAEEEKIRSKKKKAMEQKKKAMEQKKKAMEQKIAEVKKRALRDPRGKFGLSFSMTVNEADCESTESKILYNYDQNPTGGYFCSSELVEGVEFISSFGKAFGEYTYSAHSDLRKKLSSIYKLLHRPSSSDVEKWNSDFSGKKLTYMFENLKNPNEPKYILLNATRPRIYNNETYSGIMYVEYIQESEGKNLINEQKRYETFSDDL